MRLKPIAIAAAASLVLVACGSNGDPPPSPSTAVGPGAVDPRVEVLAADVYAPTPDGLQFAMPVAVGGVLLFDSPAAAVAADRDALANHPLVRPQLVARGLGKSVIDIVQRGDVHDEVPSVSVTAVHFRGLDARAFSQMVASTYLLATSVDSDQHNLTDAKPPGIVTEIEGKEVRLSDWLSFELAWYPYGEVLFIVLAKNPQLMASALRSLPPLGGTS